MDKQKMYLQSLCFDQIVSNAMTQDRATTASILVAILARVRFEVLSVSEFILLADNARCYQKDLLSVFYPFIAKSRRLFKKRFLKSETQRGKSLVDVHFAIAMMHVSRFCNKKRRMS